jgi:hypothetical protein
MAGKAINVKVSRVKIIQALEDKLAEMQKQKQEYDNAEKAYEEAKSEWIFNVAELALKSDKVTLDTNSTHVYKDHWRTKNSSLAKVEVCFDIPIDMLPEEPTQPMSDPFKSSGYGRNYVGGFNDRAEEISNAIRILKLSDEEVVSTSTYQSVSRYL